MELRVFDERAEPLGAIDEMASLLWNTKYYDTGTFSLLAPVTENNSKLLVAGNIIVKHDGKKEVADREGGIWRRAAQITYINISKETNGMEQIEAKGYMLGWWLQKRCICPQITTTDTNQRLINRMVRYNCGDLTDAQRRFPQFIILEQETIAGEAVDYANEPYVKLGQEVKNRAQLGKMGYDILMNERTKQYGFYLYKGKDLTAKNSDGNMPCVFSGDFDNICGQEYTVSVENCGNYIYVQGAADDGGIQPVTAVDGEKASGLELTEVFCDASDLAWKRQSAETEETIPLNVYLSMLRTRGRAVLENYGKIYNFVNTINTGSNLIYKQDYDVGDKVTCKETKWGIQLDARITEVTETYQNGREEIEVTFGDSLPTLAEQIRKVR